MYGNLSWRRFSLRGAIMVLTMLAVLLGCVANVIHTHQQEKKIADAIVAAGGGTWSSLFGVVPDGDEPVRSDLEWLKRVIHIQLSGSTVNDEQLLRLELDRFRYLAGLSCGYEAVFGIDGPKFERLPAPLTDRGMATIPTLPRLQYLSCEELPVGDTGLHHLADRFPMLRRVYLARTRITDATMAELARLRELHELDLRDTAVTDRGLEKLAALSHLRVLLLGGTRVKGAGLHLFAQCSELTELDLSSTMLSSESMHALARLPNLRVLNLSETSVGDDEIAILRHLTRLTNLGLANTSLTDSAIPVLTGMPNLKLVNLDGTRVTKQGRQQLAEQKPSTQDLVTNLTDEYPAP